MGKGGGAWNESSRERMGTRGTPARAGAGREQQDKPTHFGVSPQAVLRGPGHLRELGTDNKSHFALPHSPADGLCAWRTVFPSRRSLPSSENMTPDCEFGLLAVSWRPQDLGRVRGTEPLLPQQPQEEQTL